MNRATSRDPGAPAISAPGSIQPYPVSARVAFIPKVTIHPARAAGSAAASASPSDSGSPIAASAAIIQITAPGSLSATRSEAAAIAGPLFRPSGSSTIRAPAIPASCICSAIRNRWASPATISGGANSAPLALSAVAWISDRSESSGHSGLGKLSRESGQSRVPAPPERITGTIRPAAPAAAGSEPEEGCMTFIAVSDLPILNHAPARNEAGPSGFLKGEHGTMKVEIEDRSRANRRARPGVSFFAPRFHDAPQQQTGPR